jgi:putative ABC transport system permease protein
VVLKYLAAALGNLPRDWFYSGVIILGLAVGFASAMLIGLYVRDEFSFERFIPGYQQVYRIETDRLAPGGERQRTDVALSTVVAKVATDFPDVEHVARLERSSRWIGEGETKTRERVAWVDPDFFDVFPFPVLAGDPVAALHEPDSVVLTEAMARKNFGEDAPIGKTLFVQSTAGADPTAHAMVVRAVLKDPPDGTHLEQFKIFASGLAAASPLAAYDRGPGLYVVWSYLRLRPGVRADDVSAQLPAFAARHYPNAHFRLEAIKDLHFTGDARAVVAGIGAVGALIIIIAGINFITLMTARATRRAVEVGVRKVLGARRVDLIVQFMGEALLYVLLALGISVVIAKLALPPVNVFLERTIDFDFMRDPAVAAVIAGTALLTGLIAGFYPAVVLSSFQPASTLKAGGGPLLGSAQVRQALVIVQFAILVGLIIIAATIWRQTDFALENVLRLNEDQVLDIVTPCEPAFKQELAAIPGVSAVTCASDQAFSANGFALLTPVKDKGGETITFYSAPVDVGFFEMHGLTPLGGRFFSTDRGQDLVLAHANPDPEAQPTVVLNESGARQLGFSSPETAVGSSLVWARPSFTTAPGSSPSFRSSQIVGVVPDFTLSTLRDTIEPTMYYVDPPSTGLVFAKLEGSRLPEALRSIDDLWRRTGHERPIYRQFLGEVVRQTYRDVIIQGRIIAASTGLAILIACLGLFALAVFTTERRTKEIGVRKAMGASSLDVARLFLWRFTKPVLWATVIAWPFAFWAASHWLNGFAYRVSLPLWLFLGASVSALLIAWVTVGTQAWLAAQTKPATTLRYE